MSKIMSMLEKFNVIEKVNDETPYITNMENNSEKDEGGVKSTEAIHEEVEVAIEIPRTSADKDFKTIQAKTEYDKNMNISEIYYLYGMENSNVNTIFMLGNFINALPESLPYGVRRESVMNIVNAANTDVNKLLSDGEKRLNVLHQFENEFNDSTKDSIAKYSTEIVNLKKMIDNYEKQIKLKETMLEEQSNIIKYETQKISSIINFFNKVD